MDTIQKNIVPLVIANSSVTPHEKEQEIINTIQYLLCATREVKNPGNVWCISTKAHYGNEHFAIFPEDLIAKVVNFATRKGFSYRAYLILSEND